jgi:putative addiction module component (TIGR02574 family)
MTRDAKELLAEALQLPPDARAALAGQIIDSLDETVDEDAEEAWSAEIARRVKDLESGKVKAVPWSEARRQILGISREPTGP